MTASMLLRACDIKDSEYSPLESDNPADLHRAFKDLRSRCPVAHSKDYGEFWMLSSYEDVKNAASTPATFISSVKAVIPSDPRGLRRPPLNFDAPHHTPFRTALERTLKPSRVAKIGPKLEKHAETEMVKMLRKGGGDFCGEFGARYPGWMETEWLNLEEELAETLSDTAAEWIKAWRDMDGPRVGKYSGMLYEIAKDLVADRRKNPRDVEEDPASSLLEERYNGEPLLEEHLVGALRQSLVVGMVAPPVLLGSIVHHLSNDRELQDQLRNDLSLIPAACDEFIRMYTPYRGFARTVSKDTELHGRLIQPGEAVALTYASANRDPLVFPDPDTFILNRPNIAQHLGFGRGRHACAGRPLATLGIRIAVETLLKMTKSFEADPEVEYAKMPEVGIIKINSQLSHEGLIVFVLPTTGNGAAPPSFIPFWTTLLHPEIPSNALEDLRYAVFGLGDSSYGKYNWVAKKMSRRLDSLGASAVAERGEGDDQNEWGIESTFPKWLDGFYQAIDPLFPVAEGFVVRSATDVPPPRIKLEKVGGVGPGGVKPEPEKLLWSEDVRYAKLRRLERVTPVEWFQDVREVELEFDGEEGSHVAGDVVEIRPQNSPEDVSTFLASIGWTSIADDLYSITAASPDQPLPPHFPSPYLTTLRHLLTHELDVTCVPRVSFFEWLAFFSDGDMKEKLQFFTTGEGQDDLNDYTLRPRRTLSEVMYEFRSSKVPPEYILDLLPPLRARGFSIASSARDHPGLVQLLVAIVQYRTTMSVPRKGVCTTYLSGLKAGESVPIRFEKGMLTLPIEKGKGDPPPLIMVGPGTGVAPFRALVEERIASGAKNNLLFFGCRSESSDFYYRSEWEEKVLKGQMELSVAASRDQDNKIYVQHRIPEHAKRIWELINRGGLIYVCGSSTQMPKAVKKAFLAIFSTEGGLSGEGEAEKKWEALEKEGRIVEETWG
ncbi:NADPH-dependent diflavin oxidoreductase 1 [Pseudohyphozyma bogoriensis]|nr:NADPH-dependent diflavin oxidoreductase 1 [Pseudohyphozyma bogoriensis]